MAFIAPLKGVHFNPQKVGKLDEVVTPPYDVINTDVVDSYRARNPYNMIRLDIVKNPGAGDASAAAAAERGADWTRTSEMAARAQARRDCAQSLREHIARALLAEGVTDV